MPTLTIQLRGYGIHAGIGKIKKSTFNFWKNRNDVVEASDPNSSFDLKQLALKK